MLLETSTKGARMLCETASGTDPTKLCQNASRNTLENLLRGLHESFPAAFSEELGGSVPEAFPATLPGCLWQFFRQRSTKILWAPLDPVRKESQWTSLRPLGGHQRPPYPQFNGGEARQVCGWAVHGWDERLVGDHDLNPGLSSSASHKKP